jgi:hypothetical protein
MVFSSFSLFTPVRVDFSGEELFDSRGLVFFLSLGFGMSAQYVAS